MRISELKKKSIQEEIEELEKQIEELKEQEREEKYNRAVARHKELMMERKNKNKEE